MTCRYPACQSSGRGLGEAERPERPEKPEKPEILDIPESPEIPENPEIPEKKTTNKQPLKKQKMPDKKITINHYTDGTASVLRKPVVYTELRFFQRSDVLYQLTQQFCQRYLPKYGDRTVDQMVQAARSTKQNIAEGSSDGQTSTETELKLLGIARGSNQELLEDYRDYLKRQGMTEWFKRNPRFEQLHAFCKDHSKYDDYQEMLPKMNDEELANMAICLCHQVDSAMTKYIERKDREFTTEGGIRERMTAARLEQRASQKEIIERQSKEIAYLRREVERLKALLDGKNGNCGEAG